MDCYNFYQQCKDLLETARATRTNQTPFVTSFLRRNISVRWTQYKHRHRGEELIPIPWKEFKAFLQKNLGESKLFINSIWKKLKRDSQYQLKEVYNWDSHLQHFQSILMEFDLAAAPTGSTIARYFEEDLKPSIKAEMDQDATHLGNYKELVAKAMRAEAEAGLWPSSYMPKTDIQVLQGSWPAHTSAHQVQAQEAMSYGEDSKAFKAPASTPESESSDKARKEKKNKQYKGRRDSREPTDSTTPATGVNVAEVGDKKKKKKKKKRDASEVTCYNCNKLGHYADQYPEP